MKPRFLLVLLSAPKALGTAFIHFPDFLVVVVVVVVVVVDNSKNKGFAYNFMLFLHFISF